MKDETAMTESTTQNPTTEKKSRRRFTPEERIANREREIALIREKRKQVIRDRIDEARVMLRACATEAMSAGMEPEAEVCRDALEQLNRTPAS